MAIKTITEKAFSENLNQEDINYILAKPLSEEELNILFEAAFKMKQKHFGSDIFLYGFVYLSTYCRNDCQFCHYRKSKNGFLRYRKTEEEVLAIAKHLANSGVHLIDLTLGEDPYFLSEDGFEEYCQMISKVKELTSLPIMISPGLISKKMLEKAKLAGADWYACYQETHNEELFLGWRKGQNYQERWQAKLEANSLGYLTEEGILVGLEAEASDLTNSVLNMQKLKAKQLRAMAYVPNEGSLKPNPNVDALLLEKIMIAVIRLANPQALIPATLDVEGLGGLKSRILAGANVVTSIVPKGLGLAGVAQADFDIENENRSPQKVAEVLNKMGLNVADLNVYENWLNKERQSLLS